MPEGGQHRRGDAHVASLARACSRSMMLSASCVLRWITQRLSEPWRRFGRRARRDRPASWVRSGPFTDALAAMPSCTHRRSRQSRCRCRQTAQSRACVFRERIHVWPSCQSAATRRSAPTSQGRSRAPPGRASVGPGTSPALTAEARRCRGGMAGERKRSLTFVDKSAHAGERSPAYKLPANRSKFALVAEGEVSGFRTYVPGDRSLMSRDIGHT